MQETLTDTELNAIESSAERGRTAIVDARHLRILVDLYRGRDEQIEALEREKDEAEDEAEEAQDRSITLEYELGEALEMIETLQKRTVDQEQLKSGDAAASKLSASINTLARGRR